MCSIGSLFCLYPESARKDEQLGVEEGRHRSCADAFYATHFTHLFKSRVFCSPLQVAVA